MKKLAILMVLVLFLVGCSSRPDVAVNKAILTVEDNRTTIDIQVTAARLKMGYFIQPTVDATLRDNLGNTYEVLGGSKDLDGVIGGGLINPGERAGLLIFPKIDPEATIIRLLIPLHTGSLGDTILYGGPYRPPLWTIGAIWESNEGKFVLGNTYLAGRKGDPVAVGD